MRAIPPRSAPAAAAGIAPSRRASLAATRLFRFAPRGPACAKKEHASRRRADEATIVGRPSPQQIVRGLLALRAAVSPAVCGQAFVVDLPHRGLQM